VIEVKKLIDELMTGRMLSDGQFKDLITKSDEEIDEYIFYNSRKNQYKYFGKKVYIRGLVEISNYCKKDCYYCGIRKSNINSQRYRLNKEDILKCCDAGYDLGFRTFVMQGGEDNFFSDDYMCEIISKIRKKYKDCAITLSIGERSSLSYKRLYEAGANRFLLRHETADSKHYSSMHPHGTTLENRMKCLNDLKNIGFQTGCGLMVGSPKQTVDSLIKDLRFIKDFDPHMVGIGPFIPHNDTPFKDYPSGDVALTLRILGLVRIMLPKVLLPATTALGTASKCGREKGILAGANVVMPNLSPNNVRHKYMLYNNKLSSGLEAAESLNALKKSMSDIGYEVVSERGDHEDIH